MRLNGWLAALIVGVVLAVVGIPLYPWLRQAEPFFLIVAGAGLVLGLLGLVLRLIGRKLAPLAQGLLAAAAIGIGLECWDFAFTTAYELFGGLPAALGSAVLGVGVVPVAIAAAVMKGYLLSAISAAGLAVLFAVALFAWAKAGSPAAN